MIKVVSLVHRSCFETTDVLIPEDMDIRFVDKASNEEVIEELQGTEFLLCFSAYSKVPRQIIEKSRHLKLIQAEATGFDGIDLDAAREFGIPVCNNPGVNSKTVAELTVASMVAMLRRFSYFDKEMKLKNQEAMYKLNPPGSVKELSSCNVGLIGLGAIGKHVAKMLEVFGAKVYYSDIIRQNPQVEKEYKVTYVTIDELYKISDIVSVHVPLMDSTKELISYEQFAKMKKGVIFVNSSRGQIVDQKALADNLISGQVGEAAIDAIYPEPPEDDHPLLNMPQEAADRIMLTPHLAGVTYGAYGDMLRYSLDNIRRVAKGERPKHIVNGL